jgi:hypothetical protein
MDRTQDFQASQLSRILVALGSLMLLIGLGLVLCVAWLLWGYLTSPVEMAKPVSEMVRVITGHREGEKRDMTFGFEAQARGVPAMVGINDGEAEDVRARLQQPATMDSVVRIPSEVFQTAATILLLFMIYLFGKIGAGLISTGGRLCQLAIHSQAKSRENSSGEN